MSDFSQILDAAANGSAAATRQLLPIVYDELRAMAARKLAQESPGQTLQATALVHEAYLRLVGDDDRDKWENRRHFFAAAAEAMRRILVENARKKKRLKRGGDLQKHNVNSIDLEQPRPSEDLLGIDEALTKLISKDPIKAELVKLRFFVGMTHEDAAETLGLSKSTADRHWSFARAWLYRELTGAANPK